MSILNLLLLLVFVQPSLASATLPARAEEIVELHPGGELQRRYEVDEQGQKHGAFLEYAV